MCTIMTLPLEDNFEDIIGKAQRGLGLSSSALAEQAGIPESEIDALRSGSVIASATHAIAPVLGLHAPSLLAIGQRAWKPAEASLEGLVVFNTQYDDMTVNAALVFDPASRDAILIDCGTDAPAITCAIADHGLRLRHILITHTHPDHIAALADLRTQFPDATVHVGHGESCDGGQPVHGGDTFTCGSLRIEARETSGHAVCGISYVITGLNRPLACVGDALFAGSMGGGMVSWAQALRTNRAQLFTLPDDTVIVPGHGPLTTIGEEKAHNPFYPEFK